MDVSLKKPLASPILCGMQTSAERLRFALATRGMSPSKLAAKIGTPRQTVHVWLKRGVEHADADKFSAICVALNLRSRWLMYGTGLMDSVVRHADLRREHVIMLFDELAPEALEVWIRVGTMLLSSNLSDVSNGMDN